MVKNSQRTIYGLDLQMCQMIGEPYTVLPNTTLNEKFDILTDTPLVTGEYPKVNYYAIGVGGGTYVDNIETFSFSKHQPVDAALFEQIPFVIKPIGNDLLPDEQLAYRFKKRLVINSIEYYAYYLKKIDNTFTRKDLYKVDVSNDVAKLSKFNTSDSTLLSPVPRDPSVGLTNTDLVSYVSIITKLQFVLTSEELTEVDNVLTILYGDTTKAITEIGVCSGVEVTTPVLEASVVQIMYHFEIEILTALETANNNSILRSLEIGGMEPLILT